jgi:hypothetical protein
MTVPVNFSTPDSQLCRSPKYGCELTKIGVILLTSESLVKLEAKQVGPRFARIHARLKALGSFQRDRLQVLRNDDVDTAIEAMWSA